MASQMDHESVAGPIRHHYKYLIIGAGITSLTISAHLPADVLKVIFLPENPLANISVVLAPIKIMVINC